MSAHMNNDQRLTELSLLVHQMHAVLRLIARSDITAPIGIPIEVAGAIDALDDIATKAYAIAYPEAA